MIAVSTFAGKSVAVVGLGGSGIAAAKALQAGGAKAFCYDDNPARLAEARSQGLEAVDLKRISWSDLSAVVLAPGIALTHPTPHWSVVKAGEEGVEVIGDLELFFRERVAHTPPSPVVAITGTNGKSTTTALVGHVIARAQLAVEVGGNIGIPILALNGLAAHRHYVIECSSYQIDLTPHLAPSIGIHLNLSPDHIDRHGSFEAYAAIKERLIAAVEPEGTAIVGVDDQFSAAIADRAEQRGQKIVRISVKRPLPDGIYLEGTRLIHAAAGASTAIADLAGIDTLRGLHNAQNAAAAVAATLALGLSPQQIVKSLATFPGLAHRMEIVGRRGKVIFVNDSKATNADAARQALASFETIYWIAGGVPKAGGIEGIKTLFAKIRHAYLIGEAAPLFAATLAGHVPVTLSGTLEEALRQASRDARQDSAREPAVLLSPACASFDQFASFEARGKAFGVLVQALP